MQTSRIPLIADHLRGLQDRLCALFERFEPEARFREDAWQRAEGGGGRTRVLRGQVFEQVGVGFSLVHGPSLPGSATAQRPELAARPFTATGVSLVCHPRNPHVPTTHMNVRYLEVDGGAGEPAWWFGGGFDLTPFYPVDADVRHWHTVARDACRLLPEADTYSRYKHWCDSYFFLKHRQETRGVGGLFFDDLNTPDFDTCAAFWKAVGDGFISAYEPIVAARQDCPYGERERQFQLYRRGRYVEFNLLYDRGTLFGLQSGGRTESILMSMPPLVRWEYAYAAEPESPEARLQEYLVPREWL